MENPLINKLFTSIKSQIIAIIVGSIGIIFSLVCHYFKTDGTEKKVITLKGIVINEKLEGQSAKVFADNSENIETLFFTNSEGEFSIQINVLQYRWPFSENFLGVIVARKMLEIENIENKQIGSITIRIGKQDIIKPILYSDLHNDSYNSGKPINFKIKEEL